MKFNHAPKHDRRLSEWNYTRSADIALKYINNGDTIYDIGGNIFDHSIYYALKRNESTVYTFEPMPDLFGFGKLNMVDFNVKNVIPFNIGLGDENTGMDIFSNNEMSSFVYQTGLNKVNVDVRRLDDFFKENNLKPPKFIKIDIEGYAHFAFKGMINILNEYKPVICFEIHPEFVGLDGAIDKVKFLYDLGYKAVENIDQKEIIFVNNPEIGDSFEEFKTKFSKDFEKGMVSRARWLYDTAKNKEGRKLAKIEYKKYMQYDHRFKKWLLWSKLYVFFTGKVFKYR